MLFGRFFRRGFLFLLCGSYAHASPQILLLGARLIDDVRDGLLFRGSLFGRGSFGYGLFRRGFLDGALGGRFSLGGSFFCRRLCGNGGFFLHGRGELFFRRRGHAVCVKQHGIRLRELLLFLLGRLFVCRGGLFDGRVIGEGGSRLFLRRDGRIVGEHGRGSFLLGGRFCRDESFFRRRLCGDGLFDGCGRGDILSPVHLAVHHGYQFAERSRIVIGLDFAVQKDDIIVVVEIIRHNSSSEDKSKL